MLWVLLVLLIASLTTAQIIVPSYSSVQTGHITFYGAGSDSGGKCSFQDPRVALSNNLRTVAIGSFGNAQKCGTCVYITPLGTGTGNSDFPTWAPFTAFVNNECPECGDNNLDLCMNGDGVWDITWKYVDCPASGNVELQLKTGSSIYWTEIAVRNTKVAIATVEYYINGGWVALTRRDYNFFDYTSQVTLPVQARFTSILGEQKTFTISDYSFIEPATLPTNFQFTGSSSGPTAPTKPPVAPPTTPVKPPTAPPTTPITPPTTPTKPPVAPPTTPVKPPTAPPTTPVTPPVSSTQTCTYGSGTNTWYVEFNCPSITTKPTTGVTVTCSNGNSYPCTLASWGTYQCQDTGNTDCEAPRKCSVGGKCYALDTGASCGSGEVTDESSSGFQNISLPIGAIIGIVAAIIVILVVLVVLVARKLRTPPMEHV